MRNINNVVFMGRVGNGVEVKFSSTGTAYATLDVAVAFDDDVTWVPVTLFGRTAEFAGDHIAKGTRVAVVGRLNSTTWTTKDGQHRRRLGVVGYTIEIIDGWRNDGEVSKAEEEDDDADTDIPF